MAALAVLDESSERTHEAAEILGEQIVYAIRQAEASIPAGDCYRQLSGDEVTVYAWKEKQPIVMWCSSEQSSFDGVGPGIK